MNNGKDVGGEILKKLNEEIAYIPYEKIDELFNKIYSDLKDERDNRKKDIYINNEVFSPIGMK